MTDTYELIRRVSTIRLSRIKSANLFEARLDWYILGDCKPNYPMPAILLACAILPDLVQIAEVYWLDSWIETQDTPPMQMAEFELVAEYEKE